MLSLDFVGLAKMVLHTSPDKSNNSALSRGAEGCDQRVLFVCVSARERISETFGLIFSRCLS